MKIFSTRKLVYLAFLVGLGVVLARFLSIQVPMAGVAGVRIGFGGLPIILAGITMGPLAGGLVGAVADVAGYFLNPQGAYMPHFTLTAALTGIIPGWIFFTLLGGRKVLWAFLLAIGVGQLTTNVLLVPVFLEMLFEIPIQATMIPNFFSQLLSVPIYAYLVRILYNYRAFRVLEGEFSRSH